MAVAVPELSLPATQNAHNPPAILMSVSWGGEGSGSSAPSYETLNSDLRDPSLPQAALPGPLSLTSLNLR